MVENLKSLSNCAAFLDRDGVITELEEYQEKDKVKFILKKEDIKIMSGAIESIKILNKNNIKVIIISNQPQIARGLITEEQAQKITNELINHFRQHNAIIDAVYYCPHHPTLGLGNYRIDCECRKPKHGMLLKASKEHDIDLNKSWMVGDRISDIKSGYDAGCKTIGVKTGYACNDGFNDATPDYLVDNIEKATEIIIKNSRGKLS
ncbi:HAD family hydrolase [Candidatus Pacearchaeota archaeon]|nr:HAD family hydrolase [Candidatus Pacearchaeota archaeon]